LSESFLTIPLLFLELLKKVQAACEKSPHRHMLTVISDIIF